ncbi:DUF488 domain-containing protein [Paeniglutamicibacter sulfureus]|uniref:DUF488 domain-containing protein n=1 Tax=Paeniglutamicibacter sulfureus TaxID=43666 RepID=UPI002664FE75|nr:DUF488 domain-containing protein [Paeniglutamicibacter sulfureus]MDO2934904.1 DUF488 domain-containing protein [Paeniglutamicibacter sulfureus]
MDNVVIKRVYEAAESDDGYRVLVDRIWPRGIKKDDAELDLWLKEAGPSDELRKQFGHVAKKFPAFAKAYRKELDGSEALEKLLSLARDKERLCLLYGAMDEEHNQAVVLRSVIGEQLGTGGA